MALTIDNVRIGLHPDKTRVVVDLSEISKFKTYVLKDPWRLVIDMPTFDWKVGQISKPKASSISGIRQGKLSGQYSRVVIDLKKPVQIQNAFLLRKDKGKPDRLVIDFKNSSEAAFESSKNRSFGILETKTTGSGNVAQVTTSKNYRTPEPKPRQQITQAAVTQGNAIKPLKKPSQSPVPTQRGKRLIVLDPGHGGVDPGAIGANGVFEKHIALSMAKELKKMLEDTGRYKVYLTRNQDKYLRLYQRVDIARQRNAALFISLHADSIGKSNVRGASVYTLSEKASDQQTARLAERENKADIIAGTDLSHEDKQVANILIDIAMRDTMNQSKFFANTLVDAMKNDGIKVLDKPHRYAGFAVLKAPDIPSVLIELGFMSNRTEAQMLSRKDYRRNIARSLVYGIDAYFNQVEKNHRI
jgi:N-acetylmuramoyl-L-alanine amidase